MNNNEKITQRKKTILHPGQIQEKKIKRKATEKTSDMKCHGDEEHRMAADACKKQIPDTQYDEREDIVCECMHYSGSEKNTRLMHSSDNDEPGYMDTS